MKAPRNLFNGNAVAHPDHHPRRPAAVQRTLDNHGVKYFCVDCGVPFSKERNFKEHLRGKSHLRTVADQTTVWEDFKNSAPAWADEKDPTIDVLTAWGSSDLSNFPSRATCLHPSFTISKLSSSHRARFYRYLRDEFGEHYPEFTSIFYHMDTSLNRRFLRVKELFESLESFKVISSLILTAKQQGREIETIFDMACGHGLVGILLGYRFPRTRVVLVDLKRRPAFDAFVDAWKAQGVALPSTDHTSSPLGNIEYREADLNDISLREVDSKSLVVALHGCNEANTNAVEGARANGALWAVMPCCIPQGLTLPECSLEIDDDARYMLLCGAFANEHGAQMIRTIDRRITARPLILCGGLDSPTSPNAKNFTRPHRPLNMPQSTI